MVGDLCEVSHPAPDRSGNPHHMDGKEESPPTPGASAHHRISFLIHEEGAVTSNCTFTEIEVGYYKKAFLKIKTAVKTPCLVESDQRDSPPKLKSLP